MKYVTTAISLLCGAGLLLALTGCRNANSTQPVRNAPPVRHSAPAQTTSQPPSSQATEPVTPAANTPPPTTSGSTTFGGASQPAQPAQPGTVTFGGAKPQESSMDKVPEKDRAKVTGIQSKIEQMKANRRGASTP